MSMLCGFLQAIQAIKISRTDTAFLVTLVWLCSLGLLKSNDISRTEIRTQYEVNIFNMTIYKCTMYLYTWHVKFMILIFISIPIQLWTGVTCFMWIYSISRGLCKGVYLSIHMSTVKWHSREHYILLYTCIIHSFIYLAIQHTNAVGQMTCKKQTVQIDPSEAERQTLFKTKFCNFKFRLLKCTLYTTL